MADLLLVRAADHVLVGVRCVGFTVQTSGAPRLVAGANARLVAILPPQHVAEEVSPPGSPAPLHLANVPVWRAALSGRSRVAFTVAPGTVVSLTVAGVLAAMSAGTVHSGGGAPAADDTAIELPWRLLIVPTGRDGGSVHCVQPPTVEANGVAGLWHLTFAGPGATWQDADLSVRPVDPALAGTDDGIDFTVALNAAERALITANSATRLPAASTLELGAFGGTLYADGRWDNLEWRQRTRLGRDLSVRTSITGRLFPFGHKAVYQEFAERKFDPDAGHAAVLRQWSVLTIGDRVRPAPADPATRRRFPFDEVEILIGEVTELGEPGWQFQTPPAGGQPLPTWFWPPNRSGQPVAFPVRIAAPSGDVRCSLPLIFVADHSSLGYASLTDPTLAGVLSAAYADQPIPMSGNRLDLVRSSTRRAGDVHEVHALRMGGGLGPDGFRPRLDGLEVRVPALRSLIGFDAAVPVRFASRYLDRGDAEDVLLELTGSPIAVDFTRCAERSGGLASPKFVANALSRSLGPVNLAALPNPASGLIDPKRLFPADATILGLPIRDLVAEVKVPPEITAIQRAVGHPPEVTMRWEDVRLTAFGPFEPSAGTRLNLTVTTKAGTPADPMPRTHTSCTVNDFALLLPPGTGRLLKVSFTRIEFVHDSGHAPDLRITGLKTEFLGLLELLKELQNAVDLVSAAKHLDLSPSGVTARYTLPVPSVSAGAFSLRNIGVSVAVDVPFDGRPVRVSLGFSSRANPFNLSVLMLGGGGYLELELDRDGFRRLEAALEFGALVAIDFLVAAGEVHALGGVRFTLEQNGSVSIEGYLRVGGCVHVLGLVSVSVEMRIGLTYTSARKALVGRATLVVEIDLTLWSESVELDSGEWVLAGGSAGGLALTAGEGVSLDADRWHDYLAAFAH